MKLGMIILTVVVVIGLGVLLYAFPAGPTGKAGFIQTIEEADARIDSNYLRAANNLNTNLRDSLEPQKGIGTIVPNQNQINWCLKALCNDGNEVVAFAWEPDKMTYQDIPILQGYRNGQRDGRIAMCVRIPNAPVQGTVVCRVGVSGSNTAKNLACSCDDDGVTYSPPSTPEKTPPGKPPGYPIPECKDKDCPPLTICKRTPNGGWTPYVPSGTITTAPPVNPSGVGGVQYPGAAGINTAGSSTGDSSSNSDSSDGLVADVDPDAVEIIR